MNNDDSRPTLKITTGPARPTVVFCWNCNWSGIQAWLLTDDRCCSCGAYDVHTTPRPYPDKPTKAILAVVDPITPAGIAKEMGGVIRDKTSWTFPNEITAKKFANRVDGWSFFKVAGKEDV